FLGEGSGPQKVALPVPRRLPAAAGAAPQLRRQAGSSGPGNARRREMKRIGLLVAALGVLAGTCLVVRQTAAVTGRGPAPVEASRGAPLATKAGMRYRQAQPTHWRDVLLAR